MDKIERQTLIALGSNEKSVHGYVRETVIWAARQVAKLSISQPICSQIYQTPAFPAGAGPDFVNAVMQIETDLAPQAILSALHAIEQDAQRVRGQRWGQRTLDLDLIAADQHVLPDLAGFNKWYDLPLDQQRRYAPDSLILPHPRLQDRAFVLVPLCDVAPAWRHPVFGQTARQMCDALPAAARAEVVPLGRFALV